MKKIISARVAARLIIILLSAVLVFHVLVLTGVIPYDMVWGGRLKDRKQMMSFEIVSIFTNIVMLMAVLIKMGNVRGKRNSRFLNILLWLIAGVFLINTIGNLMSLNDLETKIFTPVTLLLTFLFARVAMEKSEKQV